MGNNHAQSISNRYLDAGLNRFAWLRGSFIVSVMDIAWDVIWLATAAFVIAGAVKGVAGIGLPTAALGVMTIGLDPRTAIALILFPMLATNGWQMIAAGHLGRTFRTYWRLTLSLVLGVAFTTFAASGAPDRVLLGTLGAVILVFVWFSYAGLMPRIKEGANHAAQIGFGSLAGFIGGMTGTWAVPIAMYLTARATEKDEFIRVTGFLIFWGSIPLVLSYATLGFFTGTLATTSALMLIPAFVGMWAGTAVRARLSGAGFQIAILIVFVLLALNLLRRAFF